MNWMLFIIGIPCGCLLYYLAEAIAKRVNRKHTGLVHGLTLTLFVVVILVVDYTL